MPTKAAYELSGFCKTRHQLGLGYRAGQRQQNGLEGKCDFPQVLKSNCCHFLGSSFGSGKPGRKSGIMGSRKSKKIGAISGEKTLAPTLSNRFALTTKQKLNKKKQIKIEEKNGKTEKEKKRIR